MNVIICEGSFVQRTRLTSYINEVITSYNLKIDQVICYAEPEKILTSITDSGNLYLLDIQLQNSISGIDAAKSIREKDPRGKIIFLTSQPNLALLSINSHVEPYAFILKEIECSENNLLLENLLGAYTEIRNEKGRTEREGHTHSFVDSDKKIRLIHLEDVLYIENFSRSRKVKINLAHTHFYVNTYISKIRADFSDSPFFSAHRSYIINMQKLSIVDVQNKMVEFLDGQQLFLHERSVKEIQKEMMFIKKGA